MIESDGPGAPPSADVQTQTGSRWAIPADSGETQQALIVGRPNGVIVHLNDAFTRLTGVSAAAAVGLEPDAVGPATRDRLRWLLDRLPGNGPGYRFSRIFETPGGRRVVEVDIHTIDVDALVVAALRDTSPEATFAAGVLAAVVEAAPLEVVVYDRGLRIVRVNPAVERAGRIGPMHIGMRLTDVVPDVCEDVVHGIERVFRSGEAVVNHQVENRTGRSFLVTLCPIRGSAGQVVLAGCLYSDVTDRVAAERALVESEQHRRRILTSMLQAEEDERSRIATELHADTVQVMTASLVAMDRIALAARRHDDRRVEEAVMRARATLEEATERTRRLMFELRPTILHEHGLTAAIGALADQIARGDVTVDSAPGFGTRVRFVLPVPAHRRAAA